MAEAPVGRDTLLTYVGGVLAVLGTLIYPVGVLKLWIQLRNDYDLSSTVSWYAMSLVPTTVVAGEALSLFLWSIATNGAVLALMFIRALRSGGVEYKRDTYFDTRDSIKVKVFRRKGKGVPSQLIHRNPFFQRSPTGNVAYGGLAILLLLEMVFLYFRFVDSILYDTLFLVAFLFLSVGGGALGGYLITTMPHAEVLLAKPRAQVDASDEADDRAIEEADAQLQDHFMSNFRRWLWTGLGVAYTGAFLATLSLIPLTKLDLPEAVVEENGKKHPIALLSHSGGYWHGFENDCESSCQLLSIPDQGDKVKVQISAQPSDAKEAEQEEA